MTNRNWKILKVFLSSTFKDMEITRDRLASTLGKIEAKILERCLSSSRKVFPHERKLAITGIKEEQNFVTLDKYG